MGSEESNRLTLEDITFHATTTERPTQQSNRRSDRLRRGLAAAGTSAVIFIGGGIGTGLLLNRAYTETFYPSQTSSVLQPIANGTPDWIASGAAGSGTLFGIVAPPVFAFRRKPGNSR